MPARLENIYRQAVAALSAEELVLRELAHAGAELLAVPRVTVLALGKPALAMARGAHRALPRSTGLVVSNRPGEVPPGYELMVGEHPVPDAGSLAAGVRLMDLARAERSAVLFLVGGGGSALACAPAEKVALLDKAAATKALLNSGAPISQVNAVRKHLSVLKGGQLAAACPAAVRTAFILSDVVGGAPESVSSGPTVADPSTFAEALEVLSSRQVPVPNPVVEHLERGLRGLWPETPKPGDMRLAEVDNRVLATVEALAREAARQAEAGGWRAMPAAPLSGPVEAEAERLAREARALPPGALLVAVGEPTVRPRGGGQGGRAQHLALLLSRELAGEPVEILAAGSDGQDFTTGAAGAQVDGTTWRRAEAMGFDPAKRLERFDSAPLCAQLGVQLPGFESDTNLTDLVLIGRS